MKNVSLLSALAALLLAATAAAHSHLQKSSPAEGSTLTAAPANLVLDFSEASRVTAAWIQKGEEPKQTLGPLPKTSAQEVTIALPKLASGSYAVSWRVVGDDGHLMSGQLHFTVAPQTAANQPAANEPVRH